MSKLILRDQPRRPQVSAADQVLLRALITTLAPPPPPRPVANAAPPAWAVKLNQRVEEMGQRLQAITAKAAALDAPHRQPLIEFITVNSQEYTAKELATMSTPDLERVYRLVGQAVGPRGQWNALAAQGLVSLPYSLRNNNEWEPYEAPQGGGR